MLRLRHFIFGLLLVHGFAFAQDGIGKLLTPSDSINYQRRNFVLGTEAVLATGAIVGLSTLWYNDYPTTRFHFINDNSEWLQMDKAGHVFSAYHMGKVGFETLRWSGVSREKSLVYGGTLGFAFLAVVEVFDGYSAQWGASSGDLIANAAGTGLFAGQELLWKEQRIIPKFSFHRTYYAGLRPEVLGSSFSEQLLKDYNGQTYWLSANIYSFFKSEALPKWLNVAVGYGADGMVSGRGENIVNLPVNFKRSRQFYLSLDVDLEGIHTKSRILSTLFSLFNTVKIPAPAFEISTSGKVNAHLFYF